ncbi:sigma-70 family RNA polymerase sigma factor [Humibacillus xanthopallidus]|nr:sigma-70 family RNA polymerase sigma factor [Humibacillus xanthopallidus]
MATAGLHAERDAETARLFAALADAPDGRARAVVLERLVLLYLDLCGSMASRYDGRGIEHDDLEQVARLALVKAIDRYVPGQGPSFAAFAVPTISGELKRHFRDRGWMVRPPRRLQEMRVQVQSCRNRLEQECGHSPSDAEVARALGVSRASVKEAVAAASSFHPTSLDAGTTDDESGSVAFLLGDVDESLARVDDRVCLGAALSGLDAQERQLLALRYVDELTQREIGVRLGISQMQVSRALRRLVADLRVALADDATAAERSLEHAS